MPYEVPQEMQDLAKAASLVLGAPDEKTILAQWIAENAPFSTNTANNPGNIRCIGNFADGKAKYPWFFLGDSLLTNSVVVYKDVATGVLAYILLMRAFYANVWTQGSPQACLEALGASSWDAGHYELPGGSPGSSLLAIYAELAKEFPTPAPGPLSNGNIAGIANIPTTTVTVGGLEVAVDATGTAEPVRSYTVAAGGEWIAAIARRQLGNATRWPEIYVLNPQVDIRNIIPAGTTLLLPAK